VIVASNFLVPNATFVVELLAFLGVLAFLARYVLPPVNKMVDQRQGTIRQALIDAETAKSRAAEAEAEYKRLIAEARAEARGLVEEANKAGEQLRASLNERGEQEYERRVALAVADIEASARRASEDIRRDVASLVVAVVERVIGQGFDADAQRQLIDRSIGEVETEASTRPDVSAASGRN
jgi:F-type H+-transporting ATPase subunit b